MGLLPDVIVGTDWQNGVLYGVKVLRNGFNINGWRFFVLDWIRAYVCLARVWTWRNSAAWNVRFKCAEDDRFAAGLGCYNAILSRSG